MVDAKNFQEVYKLCARKFGASRRLFHWDLEQDAEGVWMVVCTVFDLSGTYGLDKYMTADELEYIILSGDDLVNLWRDELGEGLAKGTPRTTKKA